MNRREKILSILRKQEFNLNSSRLYIGSEIPTEKAEGATRSYASGVSPSNVLGLLDTTLFGGATNGIVFTEDAVFFKEFWDDGAKFYYDELEVKTIIASDSKQLNSKISDKNRNYIYVDKDTSHSVLCNILTEIKEFISNELPSNNFYRKRRNSLINILNSSRRDISDLYTTYVGDNIPSGKLNNVLNSYASSASAEEIIGLTDTTLFGSAEEGIVFSTNKIYIDMPFEKAVKIWYDDISSITNINNLLFITTEDGIIYVDLISSINAKSLVNVIKKFIEVLGSNDNNRNINSAINAKIDTSSLYGNGIANYKTINKTFEEAKFHSSQGHGFAAERGNHLIDKLTGKDARILGDSNIKNGADRLVNGVQIQSKYCKTGYKCISECFESGKLRYLNADGSPMKIEVPRDMYDDAIREMQKRIRLKQVPGVTDINEASKMVKPGQLKYSQAVNLAKAGTIESIAYDSVNGIVSSSFSFGITSLVKFATSIWNGDGFDVALSDAAYEGLRVGGVTFITSLLVSQLSKAGLNTALTNTISKNIDFIGKKGMEGIVGAFRDTATVSQSTLSNSAAKILSDNIITGAITIAVLSSADIVDIFSGKISASQLFKNLTKTTGTVAAGSGGWMLGAAAGSIVPGIGTIIGGIAGSIIGGAIGNTVTDVALGFIEEDAEEMIKIIEKVFKKISDEYLLSYKEAEKIVDKLKEKLDSSRLKDMFSSSDKDEFAEDLLIPIVERQVNSRSKIFAPSNLDMFSKYQQILVTCSVE